MVAVATVVTTVLNQRLVRETVSLRKAETDPDIALYIEPRKHQHGFYNVVIRNVGRGPAYRVSFLMDRSWDGLKDSHFSDMVLFKDGVKYLAPDQEIRSFVGTFQDLDRGPLTVGPTYYGKAGRRSLFTEEFTLDVRQFMGTVGVGRSPEREVVGALKQIAQDLHRLQLGWRTLRVRVDGFRVTPEQRWREDEETPRLLRPLRAFRAGGQCVEHLVRPLLTAAAGKPAPRRPRRFAMGRGRAGRRRGR
jgi:hypothetical protein